MAGASPVSLTTLGPPGRPVSAPAETPFGVRDAVDTRIEPPASAGEGAGEGAGDERRAAAAAAVAEAAMAGDGDEDVVDCGVMCSVSSSSRRRVLPGLSPTQSSIT